MDQYDTSSRHTSINFSVYVENGLCMAQASTPAQDCSAQAIQDIKDIAEDNENNMTREAMSALCRSAGILTSGKHVRVLYTPLYPTFI